MITRRNFLRAGAAGTALAVVMGGALAKGFAATSAFPVTHTDDEWRKLLSADQFAVLRQSATERAFTSPLLEEHRKGTFTCAGCQNDLFASDTKFDSGTGWPSFWAAREGAVGLENDTSFGMQRTAVHCSDCGGHLGHVFDDGPKPTGKRFCMNGVALGFTPAAA